MSSFRFRRSPQTEASKEQGRADSAQKKGLRKKGDHKNWISVAAGLAKYIPALVVGFVVGVMVHFPGGGDGSTGTNHWEQQGRRAKTKAIRLKNTSLTSIGTNTTDTDSSSAEVSELKMVFVVRQDLKMGGGKAAAQCAHAAVGIYNQLLSRQRPLLSKWEQCGQPKIVVTCKNQQEMNELRHNAERAGLPTFTVSDAGRTQVAAGSKTVLAIGPGPKDVVDSITRHLRLL